MSQKKSNSNKIALQLVGSPTSKFFFDLSMLYAKDVVTPQGFELLFLITYPDDKWSLTQQLDNLTEKQSLNEILPQLKDVDLVVPHLFCEQGLTSMRIFFEDILAIPLVGSSGHVLKMAQDKYLTKQICGAAGVNVPAGQLIDRSNGIDASINLDFPVIVKPNNADNSDGLSLIVHADDLDTAFAKAKPYDSQILVEQYIAGREIRGAILELDGSFKVLPFIEYAVNDKHPIRNPEDKLAFDNKGNLKDQSQKLNIPAVCPAPLDEDLKSKLADLMIKSHKAIGCRDFSMFDFRIDKNTGKPYLLEAGLFWSFSHKSMISNMLAADHINLLQITEQLWTQAIYNHEK